jgi:hypothetical protein
MYGENVMGETIYSLDKDLWEAETMAEALIPYVYENRLYANVGAGGMFAASNTPSLTLGALLMRLRRLHALEDRMTDAQRATLAKVSEQHDRVRKEWTLHYHNKLVQEANSRLKQIKQYVEECREDPRACAASYLPEALRRTIVQEIADVLDNHDMPSAELDRAIREADGGLRRYASPSDFIWAQELQSVYPKTKFWWLYAQPQPAKKSKSD